MSNSNEMFIHFLQDAYNAEQQLIQALPKMVKAASSPTLAKAFQNHLKETERQIQRLEQVFQILGLRAQGATCQAMKGLIEEAREIVNKFSNHPSLDAGLIAAAQKVEHYEIASYGALCSWSKLLKLDTQIFNLLNQNLEEEKHANQSLTTVAEKEVNVEMLTAQKT